MSSTTSRKWYSSRIVKTEAIEALLYGCIMWALRQEHYSKLRTVHQRFLLCIIGAQHKRPDHRMASYNRALHITRRESIETTLRARRHLWARAPILVYGGRLPKQFMFENLEGAVRRGWSGKEKEWIDCVNSDVGGLESNGVRGKGLGLDKSRRVCGGLWPRGGRKK